MSIKPKYSRLDGEASKLCETIFFIWDERDGSVGVEATEHPENVVWPRQVLRVLGPSAVPPPAPSMTSQEFTCWRESLDAAGFECDVRSK